MQIFPGFTNFARSLGAQGVLFFQVLARLHHIPKRRAFVSAQLYGAGNKVLHVVLLVSFVMGMVLSLQTGLVLADYGQPDQVGIVVAVTMAREMGPFITAIILSATVGSALAAEIGTMAVSDELSALEVLSVDKISFIVMPRVVALILMAPVLTIFADTMGIVGGGFVARSQLGVSAPLYYDSALESLRQLGGLVAVPKDVYGGLMKSMVFGGVVAIISCAEGLRTRGGALGVGDATRTAVRDSIIAIIIVNYFITWFLYQN